MKRSLLFLSTLVLIYSCTTTTPKTVTEMEFNVDSSLVNKPVTDTSLGISYAIPAGWQNIGASDDVLRQVSAGNVRISNMLRDSSGNIMFSLTDVRQVPDSVFNNIDQHFKTVLNPSNTWRNIQRDEFITSGFQVKQYVMAKEGQTFFKMLFGDRLRPSFQIDYSIIIDSAYTLNTKTFES